MARAIALLLPHLGYGGVERVTLNLAAGFRDRGYRVHLVVATHASDDLRRQIPPDVELVSLGARRMTGSIPPLLRYLRRTPPRVLISSKTHANVVATVARGLGAGGTRHIICEHSKYQFQPGGSVKDRAVVRLAAWLYSRADGVVAVSKDVAGALSAATGLPAERISVIPNPVVTPELRERRDAPVTDPWLRRGGDGIPTLVGLGRLVPEKGFDVLIRAFAEVRDSVEARLLLLGEGEEREVLGDLARSLGIDDRVRMPGYAENPLPYLREAGHFVLSSRSEGFPMALVEAMFCGCSIAATRCSDAVEEILEGGRLGRLVAVEDVRALAEGIRDILGRPPPAEALRETAARYTVERVVSDYEALF